MNYLQKDCCEHCNGSQVIPRIGGGDYGRKFKCKDDDCPCHKSYLQKKLAELEDIIRAHTKTLDGQERPMLVVASRSFLTSLFTEIVGEIEGLVPEERTDADSEERETEHRYYNLCRSKFLDRLSHYKESNLPTK